ncbi:D52 family tumor protein [Lysobacter changpingensis]|jgi:hypothetical protein|uniref:D52 family tumor protein n=1 Tax=Lysobacter changpingensis TaxID=2792784 RepID=UPI001F5C60DD|nr:D52 family tumor protein [Lysobacter changpingensis]
MNKTPRRAPPPRFTIVQQRPDRRPLIAVVLGLAWLASIVGVWIGASRVAAPRLPAMTAELDAARDELRRWRSQAEQLAQREATLARSDQISRAANKEVQSELAEREEEISDLRANLAFYERLVGATGQPKGLSVHSARFDAESGGTWRYQIVLTQSLNKGAISRGRLHFTVEGVRDGKLATVGWDELHQRSDVPPQDYSFRYFQQLKGSVMLPAGFTPQRVRVSLDGGDVAVEQTLGWQIGTT